MSDDDGAIAAHALAESVYPLFAGKPEKVQAAAIAHLTITWLMGYHHMDGDAATLELRLKMVRFHYETLQRLIAELGE